MKPIAIANHVKTSLVNVRRPPLERAAAALHFPKDKNAKAVPDFFINGDSANRQAGIRFALSPTAARACGMGANLAGAKGRLGILRSE
jgi:hypothetical protein